jgi:SNF2 family DNA or RNA helicase
MNFNQQISSVFELDQVDALINQFGDEFKEEINHLLNKNGGEVLLRRQINDYSTFSLRDQNQETIIIKTSKKPYSPTCTCKYYQSNDICAHIVTVLTSIKKQILHTDQPVAPPTNVTREAMHQDSLEATVNPDKPFIIHDATIVSYQKMIKLFPFLVNMNLPRKTLVNKLSNGLQVVCRNQFDKFFVDMIVDSHNDIIVTCTCNKTYEGVLCDHSKFAVGYIAHQFSPNQFSSFLNQDVEKNKIFAEYGLTIKDEESKDFAFGLDRDGKVYLSRAPERFKSFKAIENIRKAIDETSVEEFSMRKRSKYLESVDPADIGICLVIDIDPEVNAPIILEPFQIESGKKGTVKITKLSLSNDQSVGVLSNLDDHKYEVLMDFSFIRYKHHIRTEVGIFNYLSFTQKYTSKTKASYLQYFFDKLNEHWDTISSWPKLTILKDNRNFHISNVTNIRLVKERLTPEIAVSETEKFIEIRLTFRQGSNVYHANDFSVMFGLLVQIGDDIYRHDRPEMAHLLSMMGEGVMCFPLNTRGAVMQELLLPLVSKYDIALPDDLYLDIEHHEMTPIVRLKEAKDQFLTITPVFSYGDVTFHKNSSSNSKTEEDHTKFISRDISEEDEFFQYIRSLHPNFKPQNQVWSFQLAMDEVMKNNWFIHFTNQLLDKGIKLEGVENLQKFKISSQTPTWNMTVSSGIDWFDVQVKAQWGDQQLSFKEIKKAISSGQNYVILSDGSLGMIPDEWIKKYSFLLKISKEEGDGGRISKKHFGIIDLLYNEIDNEEVLRELDAKKENLLKVETYQPNPIPSEIRATLRPYQETGYQWMQVLDEVSWGGCLADDMGLGKTLQAITFLQYVKEKYKAPTSLIICPTSLIFNWQNELDKFAPTLKYHIYYGQGRVVDDLDLHSFDLIITSYGVARNDVEVLMGFGWEYMILDESQTIKNPDAGITRALQLYKARNKFILSGTPMQNNTFDLYAQFNFLNPGLLGTRDFFRHEFASPIDRNANKDVSILLKNIIKPFMLRRTKAEVANDLPEKTESIIWCQMSEEQQEMYDTYKDFYRGALTQKIAADGMAKAGIYILEGLLRLRQICDDPRLIKETDKPTSSGVKIKEIIREIKENIGDHKILVFSQFVEMLTLIRQDLDEHRITYAYLDGGTNATKRKNEVTNFQENEDVKVFLISLKAGGVGLNLTAADYVYIVDPWWNPAVEQQAIDRVHRIGQKNNIFAYKMICKGTVEEKILKLQEKKLNLSRDLIGEDNAFFKKLTADDIQYLFS